MRTAIVSTFPPRACGIGAFAADLRSALLGTDALETADLVAVVHEPSSPPRRGLLAKVLPGVTRDLRGYCDSLERSPAAVSG